MSTRRILLTGGTGWVGGALLKALRERRHDTLAGVRAASAHADAQSVLMGSIDETFLWPKELDDREVVVHLAARVHVMKETTSDPLQAFRAVNTSGTLRLARLAAQAGVQRFVFVSSIKVNGESTPPGVPFGPVEAAAPSDPYGRSKWEAEQGLRELAMETGMEIVIVRPPLVYGPGVKANFHSLMRAVCRGIPLPLASVTGNRRSLVALDNLVDLLITCVEHPAAANETFLAGDGEDLSTAGLLRRLGIAAGRPARLYPVPTKLIETGAALLGKRDIAQRLLGSLQVDITHTRETLGWTPPISVDEGLRRAVAGMVS
ncbi:UDP-glucose 4-epimerase family protein [Hydrogenophaga sp.]|jgi:nucleoside-diphosphate-sugar epimerase|uniref:UDP-glucose 4-epimerase family protein n=1 Tax=Hydrogenophaga sp. TaxID=1904254 RepID=UPI003F701949